MAVVLFKPVLGCTRVHVVALSFGGEIVGIDRVEAGGGAREGVLISSDGGCISPSM